LLGGDWWALVKANNPAGPVYSGVVVSEPLESEDDPLMFTEVSYLQMCSLPVIRGLQKRVNVEFCYTTSVFGAVDVPYGDWGVQLVEMGIKAHGIHTVDKQP
jgi:hypothetical protein